MGQPSTAEQDTAQADALVAVQQIIQPFPQHQALPQDLSLIDSDDTNGVGTKGGSYSTMTKKKQVGNVKWYLGM